ncbi:hypothetical protein [Burkholderia guangdongensis]|uniref:hypothetical protein n=1 Tax=Burkholderia guangdongensis TaxID=1792500 RepID=UPI001C54B571|nr:hypothetical protein [Burkholderia guangdongensis]
MIANPIQPEFFDVFAEPGDWPADAAPADDARLSSYLAALQEPTASLVGQGDRPDVATVAILGYN